jgi:hypothetical protein
MIGEFRYFKKFSNTKKNILYVPDMVELEIGVGVTLKNLTSMMLAD